MNIMYVSVTERTREIGLRMAIGGKGRDILMQFLAESMLLSITGGLIGIIVGIAASKIIGSIMSWPVVVLPSSEILSFAVCTIIGIFFGWYPAKKAASLDPIDALRYE
jgi:putative ABC transport system permease protein